MSMSSRSEPRTRERASRTPVRQGDELPTLVGYTGVAKYCQELGPGVVTARYVREETKAGRLHPFIIARHYVYAIADVHQWLVSNALTKYADDSEGDDR